MKLFYLSEMSVSNQHGGGLTVQRVLQNDVNLFDRFIHISSFAKYYPPIPAIAAKCTDVYGIADTYFNSGRIKKRIRQVLNGYNWFSKWNAVYIVKQLVKQVNPSDAYWVIVPQSELSVQVVSILYKRYKIKYAVWQMDDHVVKYNEYKQPFYPTDIDAYMKAFMQEARFRWVISPAMQSLYKSMWGVDSSILFGPTIQKSATLNNAADKNHAIRFVYFGAVTAWQLDALIVFASLLPALKAELHIYSAKDNLPESLKLPNVIYKGSVAAHQIIDIANAYDGIILPISFAPSLANMTLLNIATKMSECLASGTVTVVVGPNDAAMVQYLQPYNCAVFVTDNANDNNALKDLQVLWDAAKRTSVLTDARKLVDNALTIEPIYETWRKGYEYLTN